MANQCHAIVVSMLQVTCILASEQNAYFHIISGAIEIKSTNVLILLW